MKTVKILIGAALFSVSPLHAAAPTEDSATQLLRTMDVESNLDNMFSKLAPMFGAQVYASLINDPGTAPNIRKIVTEGRGGKERFIEIMSEEFANALKTRYPAFIAEMAKAYRKQFTDAELAELLRFSQSPLGNRFFKMSGTLQDQLSEVGRQEGMTAGVAAVGSGLVRARREMLGEAQ